MSAIKKIIARLLILALPAASAFAAFEDLGAGARAPGMGNAFTALADDAYALYYNPAGLAQLERPQFSAAYSKLYAGLSDGSDLGLSQFAYAHPLSGGKKGTLGAGLQRFALSDLYSEQTLTISYGRQVWTRDSGSRLLAGINAKYLTHSFSQLPEANNACNLQNCNRGVDPVLSGSNSKGAMDADLGFLYRFPRRFQLGLAIEHAMRPDVGFSGPDKLPMNMHMGLSYKSLWMNLSGELRMDPGPTGSRDNDFIMAAERYFPTLDYGQFGLRGSLGVGSRQWRQITTGLSYRINKIQFDYGFMMPLGTIKGTMGTHRLAVTFHFGAPTAEDEISQELIEKAKLIKEGRGLYGYEFVEVLRPHDLSDQKLGAIRQLIAEGHFRKAHLALADMTKDSPPVDSLVSLANRLDAVASYYPDFPSPVAIWEIELSTTIDHFLHGRDRAAVLHGGYALSLDATNAKLDHFLAKVEAATEISALRLPNAHPRTFVEELLYRVEAANNRRDFAQVLQLLKDIRDVEPNNVTALERVGSVYFIMGRNEEALSAWTHALPLETKPYEIESLKEYIRQAEEKMGRPSLPMPAMAQPEPEPAAAQGAAAPGAGPAKEIPSGPAAAPAKPRAIPLKAIHRGGDPRDISSLYQKGVEHYARGEYLQATAMFLRILQIDPGNAQARKALDRIEQRGPRSQ